MRRGVLAIVAVVAFAAAMPGNAVAGYGYGDSCTNSADYGTDLPNVPAESPTPAITCSATYHCPANPTESPCHPENVHADVSGVGQLGAWIYAGGDRLNTCDGQPTTYLDNELNPRERCHAQLSNFEVPAGTTVTISCGVRNFVATYITLSCAFEYPIYF